MIVGWDTSTSATTAAVLDAAGATIERRDDPPLGSRPAHTGRLLELIEAVLEESGGGWAGVTRIAVGLGPGGFTGLRIGISTARALAQARSLEIVGVSSLEALARGAVAEDAGTGSVLAVIDARRGEAFAAAWDGERRPLAVAAPHGPQALAELALGLASPVLAIGDGAMKFRAELERAHALVPPDESHVHRVSAAQICRIGATQSPAAREDILPDYRREPDATPRRP